MCLKTSRYLVRPPFGCWSCPVECCSSPLCEAAGCWQELEHPVLHVDPERPNMLRGQLSVAPRWAIKLHVLGESPYCLIDLDNPPDTQRFGCAAAPSSGKRHKAQGAAAPTGRIHDPSAL